MDLLKQTYYFRDAPQDLLEELAEKMTRREFAEGQVFVNEGDNIDEILVLESGEFVRTKVSVEVDRLTGRGRISGMLHALEKDSKAFATVMATVPSTAYTISSQDFRTIANQHAGFILLTLSREVRAGTKSLRGLMQTLRSTAKPSDSGFRVLCYDSASWVSESFNKALQDEEIQFEYTSDRLNEQSATYAAGYDAVCVFVNDTANPKILQILSQVGVKLICLRCAGFDRIDLPTAQAFGLTVVRVPAYSPYAVAEMAISLLMAVNRKIVPASARIHNNNFTLDSSLVGMDIHGKTVGVMGTGKIGRILCQILSGFGVKLLCFDVYEHPDVKALGGTYVTKEEIYMASDVIFLMMPLLPATHHTINTAAIDQMKDNVILINTSRGGLVDTKALLAAVRAGKIGGVGMDVYENEQAYFFQDWSAKKIQDSDLLAILGEKNVILTAHQAFFTQEAIGNIVETTVNNIKDFRAGKTGTDHPNSCAATT